MIMTIPFETGSRSRAAREGGWKGTRRWYKCRRCGKPFLKDIKETLPEKEKVCPACKGDKR